MKQIYHEGELSVQAQAGVREMASRVGRSIRPHIPPAAQEFLRAQPMAIVGSVDERGRVWASLLTGQPGFIEALDEHTVRIAAEPFDGDPLGDNLRERAPIGVLVLEPATRRRMRLNGRVAERGHGGIYVRAEQVYSNCPKYIQARTWEREAGVSEEQVMHIVQRESALTEQQQHLISQADTFFIASHHPEGGADASHRGGSPGFVRVMNGGALAWGDYSGNSMFQTLGNIAANPTAGLLFVDFERGSTLQLTGSARIVWNAERAAEFVGAERVIEFQIDEAIEIQNATNLRWHFLNYSSFNPA